MVNTNVPFFLLISRLGQVLFLDLWKLHLNGFVLLMAFDPQLEHTCMNTYPNDPEGVYSLASCQMLQRKVCNEG